MLGKGDFGKSIEKHRSKYKSKRTFEYPFNRNRY